MAKDKRELRLLGTVIFLVLCAVSSYCFAQEKEVKFESSPANVQGKKVVGEKQEEAGEAEPDESGGDAGLEEEWLLGFEEEPLEISTEELEFEIPEGEVLEFIEIEEIPAEKMADIEVGIVNLIFKKANVTDILSALAQQTGMNIIWGDEVVGTVTVKLENIPWEQALNAILKANKLTYEREENLIRVTTVARLNEEKEAELRLAEAEKEKEPLVTKVLTLNFSTASEAKDSLNKVLSKRGSIVVDERTNSLVITEIASNFPEVERVVMEIDTQTPQVMIEARIVETSSGFVQDLGIDWAIQKTKLVPTHYKGAALDPILNKLLGPYATEEDWREKRLEIGHKAGKLSSHFPTTDVYDGTSGYGGLFKLGILDAYDFEIAWQLLESDSKTKILSNPRVATLHNKKAYILVGERIPYQESEDVDGKTKYTVKWENVGTTLAVTAAINKEDMVTLKIEPEVSEVGKWVQLSAGLYPIIKTKKADVEVLVQSGDTVVIGGLIYEKETETVAKIPFLGDIPVIGWAFKKQKTEVETQEILVFVTPTVFGQKEKEEITRELISFEEDEAVELIEKEERKVQEEKAFEEIEKELKDLEKEGEPGEIHQEEVVTDTEAGETEPPAAQTE